MATTTKTYDSGDWKLWTYRPQLGSFVLDFSQLDGPDVLGNGTDGVVVSSYDVAEVNITSGGEMGFGVIYPLNPTVASIIVNVKDFTTDVMNDFYVGTNIAISVDNPSGFSNPYTYLFSGVIDSAMVEVIPGENFSTITIQARALASVQFNTDIGLTKNETDTKALLIKNAAAAVGILISPSLTGSYFRGTARESKSVGEWLTDLALCDFMQINDNIEQRVVTKTDILDPTTWVIEWLESIKVYTRTEALPSSGTLDETSITGLQLDWSGAGSPTGVTLTNYTDSSIVYQYGSTTADAGGAVSYSATVDVKDLASMTTIGQQLLAMVKAFRPVQITTITATNNQELDWKIIDIPDGVIGFVPTPLYPENIYNLGETVTIDLPEFGVEEVDMIIIGREINVTPDNWITTYTLWKGFTN
jgi:hypothetical protein